jgi:putative tricarboxylic transport membrane protein
MSESVSPPPKGRGFSFSIRSPRDFWGGLVLVGVAILAIWASRELPGQRGFAFGPGTAPRLFAGLLVAFGTLVALVGLITDGPRIEKYKIRGPVLVIGAILAFAGMIRPLGLVIASFVTFIISILGSKESRLIEGTLAAAAMTAFCVFLFTYLLKLPFQLWPRFY